MHRFFNRKFGNVLAASILAAGPVSAIAYSYAASTKEEHSPYVISRIRASVSQFPANTPIEDRYDILESDDILFAGVYDGHGGHAVSEFVRERLLHRISELLSLESSLPSATQMTAMLRDAFLSVDAECKEHCRAAVTLGMDRMAKTGACACVAAVTPEYIAVANAGDCRAVLGRMIPANAQRPSLPPDAADRAGRKGFESDGYWFPTPSSSSIYYSALGLTHDHNAREPRELRRLQQEHPGERDIVVCHKNNPDACYVKGCLQPTRAIGDFYLKDKEFFPSDEVRWGARLKKAEKFTPPYVTAEPELQVHVLDPEYDSSSFLLLACDGVWDVLSNKDAVAFVADEVQRMGGPAKLSGLDLENMSSKLKEKVLETYAKEADMSVGKLKNLSPKQKRKFHDDITIQILFFGKDYAARGPKNKSGFFSFF